MNNHTDQEIAELLGRAFFDSRFGDRDGTKWEKHHPESQKAFYKDGMAALTVLREKGII